MKPLTLLQTVARLPCCACPALPREEVSWIVENIEVAPRRSDPHHVTTRGAGGQDTAENLMPLCRRHHNEWDEPFKGPNWVVRRYIGVRSWLEAAERWDVLRRAYPGFEEYEKKALQNADCKIACADKPTKRKGSR